ncbi:hypothetical protein AB0F46_30745 [Streptomyces sp. NPDC026665]|uniref:hypothetical protein n=1 Tax=Streptomyces sp. NPDC026665 TaxID=3154798 RepID=UPI0033E313A1
MGVLLSYVALFLIECALMALQFVGALLCMASATLFIRRFAVARERPPVGPITKATRYALGGIGVGLVVPTSAALFIGRAWGIFETWAI